jgi:hypothetical protein
MRIEWVAVALVTLLGAAGLCFVRRHAIDLGAAYAQRLRAAQQPAARSVAAPPAPAEIAALPTPVQRYLRLSGALGKPPLRSFHADFDAEMIQRPGPNGMRGTAEQFDVVDLSSAELARAETVTLLNDLCFFAPSALLGPAFAWAAIDDGHAEVRFVNGPHSVRATLSFDAHGDLVDFSSDDRAALQPDGRLQRMRWSTPMRDFREFDGRRVASAGEAIWHRPEGDFVYGRLVLRSIRFDEAG